MEYTIRKQTTVRKAYELLVKCEQQFRDDELKGDIHEIRKEFENKIYDKIFIA